MPSPITTLVGHHLAHFRALAILAALLLVCPMPAQAKPRPAPNRAVVELAQDALRAHRKGDQKRAADLYFQAHQLDPGDGAFLWGSARSLQLDDQLELAEVRYLAFLQIERADSDLRAKARVYVAQVQAELAQRRALAAQAAAAHPLPVAATAESPVEVAPANLRTVVPAAEPTATVAAVTPAVRAAATPPPSSRLRQGLFWSATGIAVAGAVLLAVATSERQSFEAAMAPGFAGGKIAGYADRPTALRAGDAIVLRQNLGGAALAVGAVAAVVVWFWPHAATDAPPTGAVQLVPGKSADGWTLVARSAW